MNELTTYAAIDGVDQDPMLVHSLMPDTQVSFCGLDLTGPDGTWLPAVEVTEPAWCPVCVAIQDGAA